jgi:hypothetical protein
MNIDFQILFNGAVGIIGMGVGFMLNRIFKGLDNLRTQDEELTDEINKIKIALPTNYVTKPDLDRIANTMFDKLDKLSDQVADLRSHETTGRG